MLMAIIVFGLITMYVARKNVTEQAERLRWWDKSSLFWFFINGLGSAFLFIIIVSLGLKLFGMYKYSEADSLSYILERMDYKKPSMMKDSDLAQQVQAWLKTSGNGLEAEYDLVDENPNFTEMRNSFISSYVTDPAKQLFTVNPYALTHYLAGESFTGLPSCKSSSGTLLIMWATILTHGEIDTSIINPAKGMSCAEVLSEPLTKFYEGRGINVETDGESCKVTEQISEVEEHIADNIIPGIKSALSGLLDGDYKAESSRSILTSIPQKSNCGSVFSKDIGVMEAQLLSAQLNILRDEVAPAFRMGAIVFGPIQLLLLTIFFAACIGLGKRRTLSLGEGGELKNIFEQRVDLVRRSITAEDPEFKIDIQTVKNVLIRELDEEASFPFTFATYVLGMIGFIGTVIGIAASLASSGDVVRAAGQGIAAQEEAISQVTGLLGVAFDTTLIALGTSALLYYIYNYIRSAEMALIRSFN
jgi:hypothetical protein